MNWLGDLLRWFAGGPDGYMSLGHCMRGDTFWIALTVILNLVVALGYVLIARHWWENEQSLPASQAKLALGNMKRIVLFCGTCGYLFIPIKMFWPAWRLYDFFLMGLVFFTWRYVLNARQLQVVYHELGRSNPLDFELRESRAESRRKSFFLNAVSHDLRTPLNGLMLQADLAELSAASEDRDSLREALREIKICARTTADLLGSFLELGRLDWSEDSTDQTRFRLDDVIGQVAAASRPIAVAKGLSLTYHLPTGLFLISDRVKLERIIQNLVANGLKFTDRGGVEVRARVEGCDLIIEVSDTGVGISDEAQKTIFDDFYQVSNQERDSSKGFGLGLSIARRLALQIRSELTVESEVGRGSRFSLTLRGVVEGSGPVGLRANPASAALGRG